MERSCRKCLVSRSELREAKKYSDIHSKHQEARTNEMLKEDYLAAKTLEVTNVDGVGHASLYEDFPFFDIPKQLPQCVSHDYHEGKGVC